MQSTLLDALTLAFTTTLDGAYAVLQRYSLGLLGVFALIEFYLSMGPHLANHASFGYAFYGFLLMLMKVGVFYVLATQLYDLLWNGVFYTFLGWGLAAGGGTFGYQDFLRPSSVIDAGFKTAAPLYDLIMNHTGLSMLYNWAVVAGYLLAYWIIVLAFAIMAFHVIYAIIQMKFAIATGAILLPWGILGPVAHLGELSVAWITAGAIRVLVTATIMAIAVPLFQTFAFRAAPRLLGGPDPTVYDAAIMVMGAIFFAALAWELPKRAADAGGRFAFGLTGAPLSAGGWMVGSAIYGAGASAIQGRSRMSSSSPPPPPPPPPPPKWHYGAHL